MSGYRTHSRINLFIALPALSAVALLALGLPQQLVIIGGAAFAYGTLFMSPDVDLAYQIKPMSLRGILSFPFYTYARVFRHRGLSHSLLVGTLTRLAWLAMYAAVIFFVLYSALPSQRSVLGLLEAYREPILAAGCGLFLADACHILVDKLS